MKHRKMMLVDSSIQLERIEIPVKNVPIVNFEVMDIKELAQLILDAGRCFTQHSKLKLECYSWGFSLRKWVSPLLTKQKCWKDKKPIADGYILGKYLADARKMYHFLFRVIETLRQVATDTADGYRVKLIAYNKMINDTIKNCEKRI